MRHTCHDPACDRPTQPRMAFCREHWFSLPKKLRDAIHREYRPEQERNKNPSWRYMAVQRLAVAHLGGGVGDVGDYYYGQALRHRQRAIDEGAGDPFIGLLDLATGQEKEEDKT